MARFDRPFLVEAFAASNPAFLVLDIWIAHSINDWIGLSVGFAGVAKGMGA